MVSERMHRTICVETTLSPETLRSILGQYGDIRGIYAAGAAEDTPQPRYYVEYRNPDEAKHAHSLQLPDTSIYALEHRQNLVDQFYAIIPPDLPQKPHSSVLETARWSPYRKHNRKTRHTATAKDRLLNGTRTVLDSTTSAASSSYTVSDPCSRPRSASFNKENGTQSPSMIWDDRKPEHPTAKGTPLLLTSAYMQSDGRQLASSFPSFADPASSSSSTLPDGRSISGGTISGSPLGGALPLHFEYGNCLINPKTLGDKPNEIEEAVATLRAVASHPIGCAQWIIVGAEYRRRNNFEAAIAVMTAMIETMQGVGMETSRLKPALLMLSRYSLEAREAERDSTGAEMDASTLYRDEATKVFQKVYGTFELPLPSGALASKDLESVSTPARVRALSNVDNQQNRSAVRASGVHETTDTPPPSSPRHGHVKMLEREIKSLRDRQQKQLESLNRVRATKHKLEDELDREQRRRRKLEHQLEKAAKATAEALRGEEHARERCRAEVESSRRAESRMGQLMEKVVALESKESESEKRERATREYFGKLGVAFLKAARGDVGEVPAVPRV